MRVLVCGDRNWRDWEPIRRALSALPSGTTIVHGDCRGADKMAGLVAKQLGFRVRAYPANWEAYGRRAGPVRNAHMLVEWEPELVLAFHPNLAESRGTIDMVRQARAAGVPVRIISK